MLTDPPANPLADRYEVGPVIGRGAMGEVRRGRDLRLGRDVAIKYLRPDLAADADVRARFEDEARAAANLSHPAIVTVFDSGETAEGVPYLVMECLPGTTLAGELTSGPVDPARVGVVASSIAGALAVAHEMGVVHRDVKPGNILLTDTGEVKLGDFGIAKSADGLDLTATDMIIGTPAYLAPERLAGEPATARSDVYSLGVVLYEALTGGKPFRGDTPVALAHAIHTTTPTSAAVLVPGADPSLTAAIDRSIARDPLVRPASGRELSRMLAAGTTPTVEVAAMPGEPTVAIGVDPTATATMPPLTSTRGVPSGSRWRGRPLGGRLGLGLVLGAVALLGLVWLASDDRDGIDPPVGSTSLSTSTPTEAGGGLELPPALDQAIEQLEEAVQP